MSVDLRVPYDQPGPPDPSKRHKDYFWHFAQFKVDDKFFQLPIQPFLDGSDVFSIQYGLHEHGDNGLRGVVQVDDIDVAEFEAFLKALLPPLMSSFAKSNPLDHALTLDEWEYVLKLSTLWSFHSLRAIAIHYLSPSFKLDRERYDANPTAFSQAWIKSVSLARTYNVSRWLIQSYRCLVQLIVNYRPLTLEEAASIGHETAHELQALSLRRIRAQNDGTRDLSRDIENVPLFRTELDALRQEEEKYGPMARFEEDNDDESGNMNDNERLRLNTYMQEQRRLPMQPARNVQGLAEGGERGEVQAFGAGGFREWTMAERPRINNRGSSFIGTLTSLMNRRDDEADMV